MGTGKQPYFRFFASDWLAGTRGMKPAEVGIYITLIALMYENCEPLQENHQRLARQCGCETRTFIRALEFLIAEEKITRTEGGLWNARVEREFGFRREKSGKNSQAAQERWAEHNKKTKENKEAPMQTHSECNANGMPYQKPEAIFQNKKINSPKRSRVSYPTDFEEFWKAYPTDQNMSKKEAWQAWQALNAEDKQNALRSLASFRSYCARNADYRPIHAVRYLRNRRFEGHLEAAERYAETRKKTEVKLLAGTPPFEAWRDYYRRQGKPPINQEHWYFPSEWPPGHPNSEARQ